MTSSTKFIINLENPSVDIEVVSNQFGQLIVEVLLIVNIMSSNGHRDIGLSKNAFGARLVREVHSVGIAGDLPERIGTDN